MLRFLSVTVAAATVALVSTSAIAGPARVTDFSAHLLLSPGFLDQGRNTLSPLGGAEIPYQSSANPQGSVNLRLTDTDYTPTATGNFVPGSFLASFATGFALTRGSSSVEVRNLFIDSTLNTVTGDLRANNRTIGASIELFTFADSITGFSFAALSTAQGLRFTTITASTLNTTFGLTPGNTVRTGGDAGTFQLVVPEPAAFAIFGLGLGLIAVARRRAA